jgi:hypothetical protein
MADFYQRIESPQVIRLYEHMLKIQALARARGRPDVVEEVAVIIANLRSDLRQLAVETVAFADKRAAHNLAARRKRPETNKGVHLRDLVNSHVTFATLGGVGLFSLEDLDRAVNPNGGSKQPYWRAIEYGLDEGFVGRRMFGSFSEPGGPAPPSPQPRDQRAHAVFRSIPSEFGDENAGWLTINRPIRAQHFLRDAADQAIAEYKKRLVVINDTIAGRIDAIGRGSSRVRARR